MFDRFRPLILIHKELQRIADVLEYFASSDARAHNRMFQPRVRGHLLQEDVSEIMYTDTESIERTHEEKEALIMQRGFDALEEAEASENE
jgi:hypothetical protein